VVHGPALHGAAERLLSLPAPRRSALEALLEQHAPLTAAPLCPELRIHYAHSLVDVWEAAERLGGQPLPSPFWAYPWAAGCALARLLLDEPALVRGRRVLDFGCGGGIVSLAAARTGALQVTANDIDAWALLVTQIAAESQSLDVESLGADLCAEPGLVDQYDVVLCSDLAYERRQAPHQRAVLERAHRNGALVLIADAGRTYFDDTGLELLSEHEIDVPLDLEGRRSRVARCYRM
jgi:predicted nicotinamide N-methyase